MKVIRLSEASRDGIRQLALLDAPALQELRSFLSANLEGLTSQDATYAKSSGLKRLPHEQAFKILDALVPVIFGHFSNELDAKEAVNDLVRAALVQRGEGKAGKADEKKLRSCLSAILLDPQLLLKSKSIRLMSTHPNGYVDSEVITDIRPVFSTDGRLKPEAAVTCHTLRVGYLDGTEIRSFFVAMDSQELRQLKKMVDRAIAKEDALGDVIGRSGLLHVKVT